jgi:hypothetical protein
MHRAPLVMLLACAACDGGARSAPTAGPAGEVLEVSGAVTAARQGEPSRSLPAGAPVFADDTITTSADGLAVILIAHNHARWSLGGGQSQRVDRSGAWSVAVDDSGGSSFDEQGQLATASAGRHSDREAGDTAATAQVPRANEAVASVYSEAAGTPAPSAAPQPAPRPHAQPAVSATTASTGHRASAGNKLDAKSGGGGTGPGRTAAATDELPRAADGSPSIGAEHRPSPASTRAVTRGLTIQPQAPEAPAPASAPAVGSSGRRGDTPGGGAPSGGGVGAGGRGASGGAAAASGGAGGRDASGGAAAGAGGGGAAGAGGSGGAGAAGAGGRGPGGAGAAGAGGPGGAGAARVVLGALTVRGPRRSEDVARAFGGFAPRCDTSSPAGEVTLRFDIDAGGTVRRVRVTGTAALVRRVSSCVSSAASALRFAARTGQAVTHVERVIRFEAR